MNRTPLRRVSKKRAKDMKTYSALRKAFLAEHPFCQVSLARMGISEPSLIEHWNDLGKPDAVHLFFKKIPFADDVHHKAGRGINYLKTETWMAVSRDGHRWIHANPRISRANGWLV